MLDAVIDYLPSPMDLPPVKGTDPKTGADMERHASDDEPFTGLAFKIATDPFVGNLAFFRNLRRRREARFLYLQFDERHSGAHRPHRFDAREPARRR